MEVGQRGAVVVVVGDEVDLAVRLEDQVVADVVGPVGEAEAGVEYVLTPAPLVKAGGHGQRGALGIAVDLVAHVVFLEGDQHVVQLVQRGGHLEVQLVQPLLVDHRELRHGEYGVVLLLADARGAHLLAGGQSVDRAVAHCDGRADLGMRLQNGGEVGHHVGVDVGSEVDQRFVLAVGQQVVVVEAHAVEGVGQIAAGDADVDLLAQRVAHAVPVDGNAGFFLQLLEHGIVVVAAGERGDAGDDVERGLLLSARDDAGEHQRGRQAQRQKLRDAVHCVFSFRSVEGYLFASGGSDQPLTAPVMKPCSKYFCTNG